MSVILDGALPPPHLLQSRSASWTYPNNPIEYPAQDPSPPFKSPQSVHSFMSRIPESLVPSQDLTSMPTSGWYGPSVSAPASHNETAYSGYPQYVSSHPSAIALSPPTPDFHYVAKPSTLSTQLECSVSAPSPSTRHAKDSVVLESTRPSEEPQVNPTAVIDQSSALWRTTPHLMERPPSSSSSIHSGTVDTSWSMNSMGLHNTSHQHDQFYPTFHALTRSPRAAESVVELPSNHSVSPQSRRMYTSIAPSPLDIPRSNTLKRTREDDEEIGDDLRRRKRSDSTTSAQLELSEEDKLLLRLKEEESMPWKDIAARFQTDLGKTYQIPALQMRLKRLRERMRVWTEADIRALRMAHEYWTQNKFDIISQKMLEFGASEKWTARQCARKFAEFDPAPASYAHLDHLQHGFASYAMSPVEPSHPFLPYMNVQ